MDIFADLEIESVPDDTTTGDTDTPAPEVGPTCETCGTAIVWAGRGRKPRFCPDHKKRTGTGSVRSPRKVSAAKADRLNELETDLLKEFATFGKGMAKVMPVTGITVVKRSENTAHALVKIAQNNPKLLEALEVGAKFAPAFELGETGIAVATAILVDSKRVAPDSVMAGMTGVAETYKEIYGDDQPVKGLHNVSPFSQEQPVPPRFEVIS